MSFRRALAVLSVGLACRSPRDFSTEPEPEPTGAPPDPRAMTVMSFNMASGAGDRFRTAANRRAQGVFLGRSAPDVVGLQEVDLGVDRSGDADTAHELAAALAGGSGVGDCTFDVPAVPHVRADGTRIARCAFGATVFGVGFRADDTFAAGKDALPSGIMDADPSDGAVGVDRSSDAFYGNALVVRAPWEVASAYDLALPIDAAGPSAPPALLAELARDARDDRLDVDAGALSRLAAHNEAVRGQRGVEPRAALVVRVHRRDAGERAHFTVITTHLESAGTQALRLAQLSSVADVVRAERAGLARVVVAGDFNALPDVVAAVLGAVGLVHAAPADATPEIDQIWVDVGLAVELAALPATGGTSDHARAVLARVR
jgi:endonuclease/exonuclease/phosphatase family metal-dependent hydrolase